MSKKPRKHLLTADNLKKLQHQFADEDKRKADLSRKRIPQRTEGDGRSSSGKHSYGSQLTAFKQSLKKTSQPRHSAENQTKKRRSDQWFHRPDREPFRSKPEGRSRNPSIQATPNVVRLDYNDDDDYRINYEEEEEDEEDKASAVVPVEEESDDESSRVSSDYEERIKPKQEVASSDGTPLTRSSSPLLSEDESDEDDESEDAAEDRDDDDDDDEDEENEKEEEAIDLLDPEARHTIQAIDAREQSKASTPFPPRSATSFNGSTSSIPTAAPTPTSRTSSRRTKTPRVVSVASSAPSYVLNKGAYRLQKLKDKMEKERANASRAESSIVLSRQNSYSDLSMRERGTTTATPNRGGSVIRSWSRWSRHSNAGYSISEGSVERRRIKKAQKPKTKEATAPKKQKSKGTPVSNTPNSRTSSRARSGLTSVLQISRIKSEPDVRRMAVKRQVKMTADPELSRSRPTSRLVADGPTSRARAASSRSIMKRASSSRVKSEPNLKKYAATHGKIKNKAKPTPGSKNNLKPPAAPRPSTKNKTGKSENDFDDMYDFSNRKKRIPKKKERPTRKGAKSAVSNASSTWTYRTRNKSFTRSTGNASSLSMRSSNISSSGISRSRNNLSSASTVLSRKPHLPIMNSESGFYSDRGLASTPGSLRAPETPLSSRGGRSTGMRSTVTRYSSGPSRAPSSAKSSFFVSDQSLSSHSDGESTAVGPESISTNAKTPVQEEKEKDPTPTPPPPPESEKGSDCETEKSLTLPPITPQPTSYISPYTSTVRETKKIEPKKKKTEEKLPRIVRVNHPMPNLEVATKDTGMTRLVKLSKPKESKQIWMTSFWPIVWGNQEMMWPIPRTALGGSAKASDRLEALATPKKNFQMDHPLMCSRGEFVGSCGRNSVIWKVSPLAMKSEASARVVQLAQPKKPPQEFEEHCREASLFGCGRSSPIWNVSDAAKTAEERERSLQLAQPKKSHPQYRPERSVDWPVSAGAKRAVASARVEQLSRPKSRNDGQIRDPIWRVPSATRRTVASARVQELSRPKQLVEGYQAARDSPEWLVSRGALRGGASERVQVLSKPIIRETMDHVQFNPDAFTVSEAAKKAAISQRIVELAQPLSRGHK